MKNDKDRTEVQKFLSKSLELTDKILRKEISKDTSGDQANLLLEDIKKSSLANHEQKRDLKQKFFYIVMSMYVFVIVGSVVGIILISIYCSNWIKVVAGVGSLLTSIITSVIKIPTIISHYLFPIGEDDLLLDLSGKTFRHVEIMKEDKTNKDIHK